MSLAQPSGRAFILMLENQHRGLGTETFSPHFGRAGWTRQSPLFEAS